jgi:hypothetical protein
MFSYDMENGDMTNFKIENCLGTLYDQYCTKL